jgi:hypothetical protein
VWDRPVAGHVAALALALLALVPLIGTGSSFSADEGAAIIQARSLSTGGGWNVEHPLPAADPAGVNYPLELSERGPVGTAPFVKHPLYALLLAGADRVAGVTGMVLLSLLGTVAAAALAALLAQRLDPSLARPTVWAVGVASPLFFDGYLVIAHTLGAAAAAATLLAAVEAFERRKPALALTVAPLVALAVLLRTEAVFLGVGLAVAAAVGALRGNDRRVAATVGLAALLAAVGATLGEAAWIEHIMGGPVAGTGTFVVRESRGFVAGRVDAFLLTWLRPSYRAIPANLLLVVMVAGLALAAFTVRRLPAERRSVLLLSGLASSAAVLALLLAPRNIVPGLLVACPLLVAGLLLVDRRVLTSTPALLAAVTGAVYAGAVLATQYETGGSGEWGGRYFSLALPLVLPVVLLAVQRNGSRMLAGGLVACSLAMAVMGTGALRATHRASAELVATIDRAAATAGDPDPVLVTTVPSLPRTAWPTFDDQRWLLARPADLPALGGRLEAAGIDRFVFVARAEDHVAALPATVTPVSSTTYRGWKILVLKTS